MSTRLTPHPCKCFEQPLVFTNEAAFRAIPSTTPRAPRTAGRTVTGLIRHFHTSGDTATSVAADVHDHEGFLALQY